MRIWEVSSCYSAPRVLPGQWNCFLTWPLTVLRPSKLPKPSHSLSCVQYCRSAFCVVPLWLSNLAGAIFQPSHKRVRNLTYCSHTVVHTTFRRFNMNRIPLNDHEVLDGEEIHLKGLA